LGTAFFPTVIIAPGNAAVSCRGTVYTKILTPLVSLATLATVMLDDINSCLNFIEQKNLDKLDEELDALLGDLTRPDSAHTHQQH
jgi:hypothetical protein